MYANRIVQVIKMSIIVAALIIGYIALIIALIIPLWYYSTYIETNIERTYGKIIARIVSAIFYPAWGASFAWIIIRVVFVQFICQFERWCGINKVRET